MEQRKHSEAATVLEQYAQVSSSPTPHERENLPSLLMVKTEGILLMVIKDPFGALP